MWAGLSGAAACALLLGLSGELFGQAPPPPGVIAGGANQVAVIDGDTLRVSGTEGLRPAEAAARAAHRGLWLAG